MNTQTRQETHTKPTLLSKVSYASDNKGFTALQISGINFLKRSRLKVLCDQLDLYTLSLLKCGFIGHKVFLQKTGTVCLLDFGPTAIRSVQLRTKHNALA